MKNILLLFTLLLLLNSCVVNNPQLEECVVQEITVIEISEGTSNDIVIKDAGTDFYYINRGLENGLIIEDLKTQLLNKKVTLHLPKFWIVKSEYIAQLAINDEVIYSEFN